MIFFTKNNVGETQFFQKKKIGPTITSYDHQIEDMIFFNVGPKMCLFRHFENLALIIFFKCLFQQIYSLKIQELCKKKN
jgi:hypothetical protein